MPVLVDATTRKVLYDPTAHKVLVDAGSPPPTGACCHLDGSCTIETLSSCDGAYRGDGTTCASAECSTPESCCGYSPFFNGADGLYYTSVTSDCCGTSSGYSGATDSFARFLVETTSTSACDDSCTGGLDGVFQVFYDGVSCGGTEVSCGGEIDCFGTPSGYTCGEGCPPHTLNIATLSGRIC